MSDSTKSQLNLARLIYDAYPGIDLFPINENRDLVDLEALNERINQKDVGDSLFEFIVREIRDLTLGVEDDDDKVSEAIRALDRAIEEINTVQDALRDRLRSTKQAERPNG